MKIFYWHNAPDNYSSGRTWVIADSADEAREIAVAYFKRRATEDVTVRMYLNDTLQTLNDTDPAEIEIEPGFVMVDGGYDG